MSKKPKVNKRSFQEKIIILLENTQQPQSKTYNDDDEDFFIFHFIDAHNKNFGYRPKITIPDGDCAAFE
jgi:hypothetical protein